MQNTGGSNDPIKTVFDKLGETLDYEKKALRKMNVESLLRANRTEKAGLIVLAVSFFVWLGVFLVWGNALQSLRVQILFLTNTVILAMVVGHKVLVTWRMRRRSVKIGRASCRER